MGLFRQHFRQWWQLPRQVGDRSEHRSVTFLELFYDLVYVVLIAQIAHSLAGHVDLAHVGQFVFLFIIVWWSWFNGMSFHDLHGNNDIRTRVFTFIQMICVAGMAAFVHHAMEETSVPFALAYGAFQLTLTFLWWRVGVHDRKHRVLSKPYAFAFLITSLLFLGSVFVPLGIRSYMWGSSVFIALLLPIMTFNRGRNNPTIQKELDKLIIVSPSTVERFGLFTIIVLGEVVVGVVSGLRDHHHLTWEIAAVALIGILIAAGLWWVYFDFISHRIPIAKSSKVVSWMYLHLPLTAAIAAVGSTLLNVTQGTGGELPPEVKWLMVTSVAVVLLSVGLLIRTLKQAHRLPKVHAMGSRIMLVSTPLTALLGLLTISGVGLLGLVFLILLFPVFYGLKTWLKEVVDK